MRGYISGKNPWELELASISLEDLDHDEVLRFHEMARAAGNLKASKRRSVGKALDDLSLRRMGKILQAAVVLFGKKTRSQYSQCALRLVSVGDRSDSKPKEQLIYAPAMQLIRTAEDFFRSHISALNLASAPPIAAFRELFINAVAHRDYENHSGCITVTASKDFIEIRNPGSLPHELPLKYLRGPHIAFPRNPLISHALYNAGLMYLFGRGTSHAIRLCREARVEQPTFDTEFDETVAAFHLKPHHVARPSPSRRRASTNITHPTRTRTVRRARG